jgi:hypothetical protein
LVIIASDRVGMAAWYHPADTLIPQLFANGSGSRSRNKLVETLLHPSGGKDAA